jgi:hypothetical protein
MPATGTAKHSRKFSDPKQPAPNGAAEDSTLAQLREVDALDAKETPEGPLPPGEAPAADPLAGSGAAVLVVVPTPFLVQTCAQVAAGIVSRSKAAGWPGLPAMYTAVVPEEEWLNQVANNGAAVLAKRFPTLNNDATPEFALCCLALPWLAWAIPNGFVLIGRVLRRSKQPEPTKPAIEGDGQATAGDRDTRSHRERQNNPSAETFSRFPAGVSDRPDTRPQV